MNQRFTPLVGIASLLTAWGLNVQPVKAATFLSLNSQLGDYVGQGLNQTFTPADGEFSAALTYGSSDSVTVSFDNFNQSSSSQDSIFWDLVFAAPSGQTLVPKTYVGATTASFPSSTTPGLDISGEGRGCNTVTGQFVVNEAVYGASGNVESFSADFQQHCEGATPALLGEIRYNTPDSVPEPSNVAGLFLLGLGLKLAKLRPNATRWLKHFSGTQSRKISA